MPAHAEEVARWRDEWDRLGFVVLPGLLDQPDVAALLHAVRHAEPLDPRPNPLSSGAMEFRSNLFHRSAPIRTFLGDPRLVAVITALLGRDVWCRWDQAVSKRPGAGWFPWHQDNGYTQLDAVHLQLWVALTPSYRRNGGLLVAPGAHRQRLPHTWQGDHVVTEPGQPVVAIDAEPGDVVAFSSLLPHATGPNTSHEDRWAYVAEFLPLDAPDEAVAPPHLVVARDGQPSIGLEDLRPRWAQRARRSAR